MLLVIIFIVVLVLWIISCSEKLQDLLGGDAEIWIIFFCVVFVILGIFNLLHIGISFGDAICMDSLKIEIGNTKVAIDKMNNLVVVKDTKEFGVENMEQSSKTSELYIDYVKLVNSYNKILIVKRRLKKNIVFSWLVVMPSEEHDIILL